MRKMKILMLIIFCMMLAGGTAATLFMPDREYSDLENRELVQKPALTKKSFLKGKFQKKYETYLSDQFPLRDQWVDVAAMLQVAAGKKDINGVYLGKEGYLLEKNEDTEYDDDQIEENVKTLSAFLNDMTAAYGEKHVSCMMIPSKTEVLADKLPAFAKRTNRKKVLDALRSRLSNPACMMDLTPVLQKKQGEYIYYRTDHHWTTLGAYYAYQAWAEHSGQATRRPQEYYEKETVFTDFYGTTYNKVHVPVPADSVELFHSRDEQGVHLNMDDGEKEADSLYFPEEAARGFNRYNVFFSGNTFKIEVNTKAKTGKTLLLVKDSFANCFVPFLSGDYERIIMIDYRYGKLPMGQILGEYEGITDVLVMFNTEKFMENTKLNKLADTEKRGQTMEKFDPNEFF